MRLSNSFNAQIRFWQNLKDFGIFGKILFIFILLFLTVYKPFFLNKIDIEQLTIYAFTIGGFSIAFSLISYIITYKYLKSFIIHWSIIKELIWDSSHFIVIGSFNYFLCTTYLPDVTITWLQVVFYTSIVGIFPLVWDIKRRMNSNLASATKTTDSILYVKSDGNYIEIFIVKEGSIERNIVRSSIIDFKSKYKLTQCHRSYLVNWQKVCAIYGNSNGGKLTLEYEGLTIPYSRTYHPDLPSIINT